MFYISSNKGDRLGVTDTKDGVEEFYTKDELADFFHNKRIKISGFIYTGSGFRVEVKSLNLIKLEYLEDGDVFKLNGVLAIRLGETGGCNIEVFYNDNCKVLKRVDLVKNLHNVDVDFISEDNKLGLIKRFIKLKPTSVLSHRLKDKYNL